MRSLLLVVLLTLTGCTTMGGPAAPRVDEVKFDRGAFALSYAGLVNPMLTKCAAAKAAPTPECAQLAVIDQQVRQAIIDAPKAAAAAAPAPNPLDQLMPLIMKLAPLAAGM